MRQKQVVKMDQQLCLFDIDIDSSLTVKHWQFFPMLAEGGSQ